MFLFFSFEVIKAINEGWAVMLVLPFGIFTL